jgi:hypothetical protein
MGQGPTSPRGNGRKIENMMILFHLMTRNVRYILKETLPSHRPDLALSYNNTDTVYHETTKFIRIEVEDENEHFAAI